MSRTKTNRRIDREKCTRSNAATARLLILVKPAETVARDRPNSYLIRISYDVKNCAVLGGFYPLDLHKSSRHTQSHPIIVSDPQIPIVTTNFHAGDKCHL